MSRELWHVTGQKHLLVSLRLQGVDMITCYGRLGEQSMSLCVQRYWLPWNKVAIYVSLTGMKMCPSRTFHISWCGKKSSPFWFWAAFQISWARVFHKSGLETHVMRWKTLSQKLGIECSWKEACLASRGPGFDPQNSIKKTLSIVSWLNGD